VKATFHEQKIVLTKGWSFLHAFLSSANLAMAIPDIIHLKWNTTIMQFCFLRVKIYFSYRSATD